MKTNKLTHDQLVALIALLVGIVTCIVTVLATVFLPEIRQVMGLVTPTSTEIVIALQTPFMLLTQESQTSSPAPLASVIPTLLPTDTQTPVPTPNGLISFASFSNPNELSPEIIFPEATGNYLLGQNPTEITVIAPPGTNGWAAVCYPFEGNFIATVKANFRGTAFTQSIALAVSPPEVEIRHTYYQVHLVHARSPGSYIGEYGEANGNVINAPSRIPYDNSVIYMKLEKFGNLLAFYYSYDGVRWITLRESLVSILGNSVKICLSAWTNNSSEGNTAKFSDFIVIPN